MKLKTKFWMIAAVFVAMFVLLGCEGMGTNNTVKYTIQLDANGGTVTSQTIQVVENSVAQLPTPTKKGFEFEGWYNEDGTPWNLTNQVKSNTSLYAKWSLLTFQIEYDLDGGSLTEPNPTSFDLTKLPIQLKTPIREGYDFAGWKVNGKIVNSLTVDELANIKVIATWTRSTYAINYVLNGGVNARNNPVSYRTGIPVTINEPTRGNVDFLGWYLDPQFSGSPISVIPADSTMMRDVTLYAKWGDVVVTGIEITQNPTKMTYNALENFDKTGMIVTAHYNDGLSHEITEYVVDKTTLKGTDNSFSVSYAGFTVFKSINVQKLALTNSMIAAISDVTYNGSEHKPVPVVTNGTLPIIKDSDYTVEYTNNINAGTATVTIKATPSGNYSGAASVDFEIDKINYDMSNVAFANGSGQRGETIVPLSVVNCPNSVSVAYYYKTVTNDYLIDNWTTMFNNMTADDYVITAIFTSNDNNYNDPSSITATLTIKPSDSEYVDAAIADLNLQFGNGVLNVSSVLPTTVKDCLVQWTSDNNSVQINSENKFEYVRQEQLFIVTIKADVSYDIVTKDVSFNLTIPAYPVIVDSDTDITFKGHGIPDNSVFNAEIEDLTNGNIDSTYVLSSINYQPLSAFAVEAYDATSFLDYPAFGSAITIKIPIPQTFNGNKNILKVVGIKDGIATDMNATVSSDELYLEFSTTSNFEYFSVVCRNFVASFVYNNGASNYNYVLKYSLTLTKPNDPVNGTYVFDDWYADENFTNPYVFGTVLTTDVEIYAAWNSVSITDSSNVTTYYRDLATAVAAVHTNETIKVFASTTLNTDVTISSGVKLIVAYDGIASSSDNNSAKILGSGTITVASGAVFEEPMFFEMSLSQANSVYEALLIRDSIDFFPFSDYNLHVTQCNIKIESGAKYNANSILVVGGSITEGIVITTPSLVTTTNENGLICLEDGSYIEKSYSNGRVVIDLYGNMSNSAFPAKITLGEYAGFLGQDTMEVSSFPFAIKNTVDINYHDGEYTLNLKFIYNSGSTSTGSTNAIVNQVMNGVDNYSVYENNEWVNKFAIYYVADGNQIARALYEAGETVTLIELPDKAGFTKLGWDNLITVMPSNNLTLTAKYKGVLLTYMVDDELYKTVEVGYGTTINLISEPVKVGHFFSGWTCRETVATSDTTITGSFLVSSYQLTFYINGVASTTEKSYGATFNIPILSSYEKDNKIYHFSYWYEKSTPDTPYTNNVMPAHNLSLYPKFVDTSINIFEYELDANNNATIIGLNNNYDNTTAIYIPEIIQNYNSATMLVEEYPIIAIGEKIFMNNTRITSVDLSTSKITTIANYAFYGCTALTTVKFATTVNTIGSYVFANCELLSNVVIPTLVTAINDYTFLGCSTLTSFAIHKNINSLGSSAFASCTSLENVIFEDGISLSNIGMAAFSGCASLVNIVLPESLPTIKRNTFLNCTKLETITIPTSVTEIKADAFKNCTKFKTINYNGTEIEWKLIAIDTTNNNIVAGATKNYLG